MLTSIRNKMRSQKGFTLVELMIVVAIIGVLAALIVPRMALTTTIAKDTQLKANLRTLDSAIVMYYANTGAYPANLAALTPSYVSAIPTDASGHDLGYSTEPGPYNLSGLKSDGKTVYSPGSASYVAW